RQIEELRNLVSDNDRQRRRVEELATRSGALLGWTAEEERLAGSGGRDRATARLDAGAQLLGEMRGSIPEGRGGAEQLDRARTGGLRRSWEKRVGRRVGGGAAIVASTLLLALLFLRGVVQRLAVLRDNARRFSEGRPLRSPLTGHDEITEVDRAFHDMASN